MKNKKLKKQSGFTIIEMMIAITLFIVIIVYGMQSLLNANLVHKKTQDMRSILDNLSFTLDDMSKNIRIGYNYHCIDDNNFDSLTLSISKSCKDGIGLAFESSNGSSIDAEDQWVYFISDNKIWKSTLGPYCGESCAIQLTPDEVKIDDQVSGFSVLGAESPIEGDQQQPLVIIRLVGSIERNNSSTPFSIETAVSQRLIDVNTTSIITQTGPIIESLQSQHSFYSSSVQTMTQSTTQSSSN